MARRKTLAKRLWQLESLEHRCLMAADMELMICPLPNATADPLPGAAVFLANQIPVSQMQTWNDPIPSDEPPQSTETPEPAPFLWDVAASDAFTAKVNASIERMGVERPEMQNQFVVALQWASIGPNFIDTEAELDALYNQFLSQDSSGQGSFEPQNTQPLSDSEARNRGITVRLLKTVRNDNWIAGVTSQGEVVYRGINEPKWQLLDQFGATRMLPEIYPTGDRLIVRYEIPTDDPWVNEGKQAVIDMTTGEITSTSDAPIVSPNYRDKANGVWVVGGTPMGMIAYSVAENESRSLDFLPADLHIVRSEFSDSWNIVRLQGLTTDKPLEYRTVTVDLLNRRIVSDEVTDQPGAGFVAERAGDTFNILWNMDEPIFFNGQPDDIVRRTPDIPLGYFERPYLIYELPGMRHIDFPHREVNLVWSVESIAIHQFPTAGPNPQPLDYEVVVLIQVPGGEPIRSRYSALIMDPAEAQAALNDIGEYLESMGQSLAPPSEGDSQESVSQAQVADSNASSQTSVDKSVDVNTIPGSAASMGIIEAMLREIDLRLKKTQMQLGVTKI